MFRAVFLDRDGVINENRDDHVKSWREFRFLPGAPEALARLASAGVRVFVVTNQAIINRGVLSRAAVEELNERMMREVRSRGGLIEAVACCPHRPEEGCDCRKPGAGLLIDLAQRHGIELHDAVQDVLAPAAMYNAHERRSQRGRASGYKTRAPFCCS